MNVRGLTPAQLFDSLVSATGYREPSQFRTQNFNNFVQPNVPRSVFLSRFASTDRPTEASTTILQALMLMNGKLTADATSLEASRTLRAVVEAPFLSNEQKIETLYLAAVTRKPRAEELEFLKAHVASKTTDDQRKQAYAEIMWGLLNGPEFVLSR